MNKEDNNKKKDIKKWIFDINVLLNLIEFLPYKDLVAICSTKRNLYRLCKKHEDTIWERMLLRDYGIRNSEVIGKPKSYYIGLQENKGSEYKLKFSLDWSQRYDGADFVRFPVKFHAEGYAYKRLKFLVPNAEKTDLTGEQIWIGSYSAVPTSSRADPIFVTVVAKTLNLCIKFLEEQCREKVLGYLPLHGIQDTTNLTDHETIYATELGERFKINVSINYGFYQITL